MHSFCWDFFVTEVYSWSKGGKWVEGRWNLHLRAFIRCSRAEVLVVARGVQSRSLKDAFITCTLLSLRERFLLQGMIGFWRDTLRVDGFGADERLLETR